MSAETIRRIIRALGAADQAEAGLEVMDLAAVKNLGGKADALIEVNHARVRHLLTLIMLFRGLRISLGKAAVAAAQEAAVEMIIIRSHVMGLLAYSSSSV